MKKVTKLSLVAAVATLGFTSVNAQSLEEAIKNVDISGTAAYRYNNYKNGLSKYGQNNYKIALNLSSKLDDNFKVNTRTIVGGVNFNTADKLTLNAGTQGDSQAIVSLSEINFEFTGIEGTSIKVGKQAIVSPYAVAADALGNEQTGTGISASVGAGPLLVSAAYFNQINDNDIPNTLSQNVTNLRRFTNDNGDVIYSSSDNDNTSIFVRQSAATASIGLDFDIFKADVSYLGIIPDSNKLSAFHVVGIGASVNQEFSNGKIGFEARYSKGLINSTTRKEVLNVYTDESLTSSNTFTNEFSAEQSLLKLAINGSYSIVNAKVTYLIGGDKGAKISLDEDSSATINGWETELGAIPKAKYLLANVNFDVLNDFNIAFNYNDLRANEYKQSEYYTQLNYKLAKNLSTFIRYGNVKTKGEALDTRGRLQVAYSF